MLRASEVSHAHWASFEGLGWISPGAVICSSVLILLHTVRVSNESQNLASVLFLKHKYNLISILRYAAVVSHWKCLDCKSV